MKTKQKTALITGASRGLGLALAKELASRGWNLLINARQPKPLLTAQRALASVTQVAAISGDVRDEIHLLQLAEILQRRAWRLDLIVNNASVLGSSPLRPLLEEDVEVLHQVFHTNSIAPISLLQRLKTFLNPGSAVINVSSDAAAEAYETWGAYAGSKAALDHMTAILARENPDLRFYAFDPGDMRTDMYQAAFPGEDISDRPLPTEAAVPALMQLIDQSLTSGRYTVSSVLTYEDVDK